MTTPEGCALRNVPGWDHLLRGIALCCTGRCDPHIHLPFAKALGDILFMLNNELRFGDRYVIHLDVTQYRQVAAATTGLAPAMRDTEKRAKHWADEWGAHCSPPLSMKTFGYLVPAG
jgi:hypothetical protein